MEDKKLILAIETSGMTTELALMDGTRVIASAYSGRKFAHSEVINMLFELIISTSGVKPEDIGYAAVSIGPGFFTALRVGLSFAKGLAFVHGTKLIPVVTLDALAWEISPDIGKTAVPAIDAQKNEVYYAVYRPVGERWERISPYGIASPDEIRGEGRIFVGSGAIKHDLKPRPHHDPPVPSARWIGTLAIEAISRGEFADPGSIEPFYVRLPDAVVNRMKKEKKS